jgi:hypothetical protein
VSQADRANNAFDRLDGRVVSASVNVYTTDYHSYRTGERASGGPVRAGARYLVGERGPEEFVPAVSGTIIPNHQLRSSSASLASYTVGGGGGAGGGPGGPSSLQLAATFVLPSGEVVHKQLITYSLNTGRTPAQLFPDSSR